MEESKSIWTKSHDAARQPFGEHLMLFKLEMDGVFHPVTHSTTMAQSSNDSNDFRVVVMDEVDDEASSRQLASEVEALRTSSSPETTGRLTRKSSAGTLTQHHGQQQQRGFPNMLVLPSSAF